MLILIKLSIIKDKQNYNKILKTLHLNNTTNYDKLNKNNTDDKLKNILMSS